MIDIKKLAALREAAAERKLAPGPMEQLRKLQAELQAVYSALQFTPNDLLSGEEHAKYLMQQHKEMCARLQETAQKHSLGFGGERLDRVVCDAVDTLVAEVEELREDKERLETARPYSEWNEDDGAVLWHMMPIQCAPYVGDPMCCDWPFKTEQNLFWTPLPDCNAIQDRFDAARKGEPK